MSIYSDVKYCDDLFEELCVNNETGEIDMVQEEELIKLRESIINEGAENLCKVRVNRLAEIEALKQEEKRIAEKRKTMERALERFEDYIDMIYRESGQDKLKAGTFTLSHRKSVKTIVENEELLPPHYKIQKVEYKPDLKAIKNDIQNGQFVAGCHLEEVYNLQIK